MSRVLIIEDEMLIAFTLQAMLEDLGHEVADVAGQLDKALKSVEALDFDVAILDLKLGTEMTIPVADLHVERKKAFIFSTGFGEAEVSDRCSQPVLEKPYDEARLGELSHGFPRRLVLAAATSRRVRLRSTFLRHDSSATLVHLPPVACFRTQARSGLRLGPIV
ncbi:response regulator [Rhizobium sp. BK376]|uniref:response regulator n=1 Tax=Rhizobium sp. BK376 TaxID=2512149 RepID=UPI0010E40B2B|nr:response regulator [Rhizobium sp. BK376]TCR65954.1 response regulator receiver domain-containing protein [Rhizobium sp. BK376]